MTEEEASPEETAKARAIRERVRRAYRISPTEGEKEEENGVGT